jgi:hypothetical protein
MRHLVVVWWSTMPAVTARRVVPAVACSPSLPRLPSSPPRSLLPHSSSLSLLPSSLGISRPILTYNPQDIVRARARTIGITETTFNLRDHEMLMVDVRIAFSPSFSFY